MLRTFRLPIALLILVGALGRAAAAQDGPMPPAPADSATATAVVWHTNGLDAMVEAVDNRKALVVLFRNDPADDPSRLGRDTIEGLKADGLAEFRDRAVFVEVVFHRDVAARDDWGMRLARRIRLTDSPTLSIVAPNMNRVTEVARSEGFFKTAELKEALRTHLPKAFDVKNSWLPASSRELVAMFAESLAKADRQMHAACFVDSIRTRMVEVAEAQTALGNSKRRLLSSIDERFGLQTERLAFVDDDEEMSREMREVTDVEHGTAVMGAAGLPELPIVVTRLKPSGAVKKTTEKLLVVVEGNGLRFTSADLEHHEARLVEHVERLKKLATDFDAITARVEAGRFDTAESARDEAITVCRQPKSPR